MLSQQQLLPTAIRRRPLRSLRQQYDVYVMDRIEHYKNSIPRGELLRLAAESMDDIDESGESQFVLTEMVIQEAVDARIKRRLGVKSFETWRKYFPSCGLASGTRFTGAWTAGILSPGSRQGWNPMITCWWWDRGRNPARTCWQRTRQRSPFSTATSG